MDEEQKTPKPPKPRRLKASGEPDMRGHGEGSRATRFDHNDGRRRPGRTKGSKDAKTIVELVRNMTVPVDMPGLPRRIDTYHASLLKLREKALKGDLKAISMLFDKFGQYAPPSTEPDLTAQLLDEDEQILMFAQQRGIIPPPPNSDDTAVDQQDDGEEDATEDQGGNA